MWEGVQSLRNLPEQLPSGALRSLTPGNSLNSAPRGFHGSFIA